MRRLLVPFALLIVACSGEGAPGAPSPAAPVENAKANAEPVDAAPPPPSTTRNDVDDPAAAAECAKPRIGAGSLSTLPAEKMAAYGIEVGLRVDAEGIEHLDLTLLHPPDFREDEKLGKVRRDRYEQYHFAAPPGTHLQVGHFPVTRVAATSRGFECSRTSAVSQLGSSADASNGAQATLEIVSQSDTRVAGWFEMPGHSGQIERVHFDAPLGDTLVRNFGAVCCLK